jgi:hypothetical protein
MSARALTLTLTVPSRRTLRKDCDFANQLGNCFFCAKLLIFKNVLSLFIVVLLSTVGLPSSIRPTYTFYAYNSRRASRRDERTHRTTGRR